MRVHAQQGDTVDALCHRYYGRTAGVVEAVLNHNRGVADFGPTLPHGTAVELPELTAPPPSTPLIQLWD
ncbi:phage tail protein [Chitinimonas arctica]|uniref:Phage tail protein n=1 Tax=Chitinimonas arctica TaxID=2594795 RepID=A0A516SHW1_9NEIS|nr:tail protein X [Chitinimonas arctica]QDQ27715.1 phage tail protein [Chitinimonas arctica]QDQ29127.1 phage tail protein [Chitinimonas arctica]